MNSAVTICVRVLFFLLLFSSWYRAICLECTKEKEKQKKEQQNETYKSSASFRNHNFIPLHMNDTNINCVKSPLKYANVKSSHLIFIDKSILWNALELVWRDFAVWLLLIVDGLVTVAAAVAAALMVLNYVRKPSTPHFINVVIWDFAIFIDSTVACVHSDIAMAIDIILCGV